MKNWMFVLLTGLSLALTGCFDMMEEVYLNKDGSGRYLYTVDLSKMFEDSFMKDIMAEGLKSQTGESELEMDSIIRFSDMENLDQSGDLTDKERQLVDRLTLHMQISQKAGKGKIVMEFPFDKLEEVNQFSSLMEKIGKEEEGGGGGLMGGLMGGSGLSPMETAFRLKGRTLSRELTDKGGNLSEALDQETLDMMKMFFENATFKTVYHLPGKVVKADFENAVVDGNTVSVDYPFLDLLEGEVDTGGEIKFKKN
jgi:hypothetical protein